MADHKFTIDWDRRMEEIIIPLGFARVEELPRESRQNSRTRGERKTQKLRRSKQDNRDSPKKQTRTKPKMTTNSAFARPKISIAFT